MFYIDHCCLLTHGSPCVQPAFNQTIMMMLLKCESHRRKNKLAHQDRTRGVETAFCIDEQGAFAVLEDVGRVRVSF